MAKKNKTNKRKIKHKKSYSTKNMRGGSFTPDERNNLLNEGFSDYQINLFENLDITFDDVTDQLNEVINQDNQGMYGNSDDIADQVTMNLYNQHIMNTSNVSVNSIPHAADDIHFLDDDSQGSLHLSDLNNSQHSDNGYTTTEDFTQNSIGGGKKRTRKNKNKLKNKNSRKNKKIRK